MEEKTIRQIANNPRVQEAFVTRFNATEEERLHPRAFTVKCIRQMIKDIVTSHESDKVIKEAIQSATQAEELVL